MTSPAPEPAGEGGDLALFPDLARPEWRGGGFGNEKSGAGETDVWLTPRWILDALGAFDMDPCGYSGWATAAEVITPPHDGLTYYGSDDARALRESGIDGALVEPRAVTHPGGDAE